MNTGISKSSLLAIALVLAPGAVHAGECPPNGAAPAVPQASAAMPVPVPAFQYNPWADFMRMQMLMDSQFNAMNAVPVMFVPLPALNLPTPASTLQATQDGYRLVLPLPGFKADGIHVRLDGQLLFISAETSSMAKAGDQEAQSRSRRAFAETLTLPGPVQATELKESFENGVLTVTIPSRKGTPG